MATKLRSFTGCLTCRRRHRKCDERKPRCTECTRLDYVCQWSRNDTPANSLGLKPDEVPPSLSSTVIRRYPALLSYQKGAMVNGYEPFHDHSEFQFVVEYPKILSTSLTPFTALPWLDLSSFLSLALKDPTVRHAFAAFAARAHAIRQPEMLPLAVNYYAKAVVKQREYVQNSVEVINPQSLFAVMIAMGLYEWLDGSKPRAALMHSIALLHHVNVLLQNRSSYDDVSTRAACNVCIEMAVMIFGGCAIFHGSLDFVTHHLDWKLIGASLRYPAILDLSSCQTSPLLQGQFEIYRLLLHTIALGRMQKSQSSREIHSIHLRLEALECQLPNRYSTSMGEKRRSIYILRWQFMISLIRIYVCKIAVPETCSGSPRMQQIANWSMKLFLQLCALTTTMTNQRWTNFGHESDIINAFSPHTDSPLGYGHMFILAAAVHKHSDFEHVSKLFVGPDLHFMQRHVTLFANVFSLLDKRKRDNLHHCRAESGGICSVKHDGLDLLLLPDGVFGVLD